MTTTFHVTSCETCLNPRKFFFGGYVTFLYKYQNHSQNQPYPICPTADRIDERSNPTSQPAKYTTNSMQIAIGALLFGNFDFLVVILRWTRTVQVQEINQKSTRPKWPRVYRLDNGSYSTIQPPTYPTYIMKILIW